MSRVIFIPKRPKNDPYPWITFGCDSQKEYEKWIPEICGICCLKMVGDTFGKTNHLNLYNLTMKCFTKGGFRILPNGEIQGVFHYPLLETAYELGLNGEVRGIIDSQLIIDAVNNGRLIVLSIDLKKVRGSLAGSHLILIHHYDKEHDTFLLHDTSCILHDSGQHIKISRLNLDAISNRKGIIFWDEREDAG